MPLPTIDKDAKDLRPLPTSQTAKTTPEKEAEIAIQSAPTENEDLPTNIKATGSRPEIHEENNPEETQACQDPPTAGAETDPQVATGRTAHSQRQASLEHREAGGQHQLRAQ